ncbi:MAG TPA: amino acid ABC transporter substrate-binding protein [Chloroflexota bacterium]|nr:amino acid ABC transporter substrate-binding protein [Chloroflexota bacterium]
MRRLTLPLAISLLLAACGGGAPSGAPGASTGPAGAPPAKPSAAASAAAPASTAAKPAASAAASAGASAKPAASGAAAASGSEIKLGAVLPITGAFASSGKYFQQGYQMATDEVNGAGGVDVGGTKMKVTLDLLDDGSNGTNSRALVEKLVTQDKVNELLGGYDTSLVEAQEVVPDQYKIPMVEGGGAASAIFARGYKYVFGTLQTIDLLGSITMDFLQDQVDQGHLPKPSKIALVWENTDHGKDYQKGVQDYVKAHSDSFQVVLDQSFDLNGADFTPLLTQVKSANADIFLSDAHLPDYITMHRQYTQMGLSHKLVSYAARGPDQSARQALGPAADGLVAGLWWSPVLPDPRSQKFAADYKAKYNATADWFQALAYETARVMFAGINKAGSLDGTKVRDAIAGLDIKDSILPGGEIKFQPDGRPTTPYMMVQNLPNNEVQITWPKDMPGYKPATVPFKK